MNDTSFESLYTLLVEPSRAQTRIISAQLESLGLNDFQTAASGEEALASAAASPPDLVLSAMHLPDMTGADLLHALRARCGTEDVGFMLVSSETSIEYLMPIRQAGASAILPKPFVAQDLARALALCLDIIEPSAPDTGDVDIEELKVLVVDDSHMCRRVTRKTLAGMGILDVTECDNGLDAIDRIEDDFFDFVITDYVMPGADGRELVEHIRNRSRQPTLPVLMVTTVGDHARLEAVQQAGVSAIIDKPFEAAAVRAFIEGALAT